MFLQISYTYLYLFYHAKIDHYFICTHIVSMGWLSISCCRRLKQDFYRQHSQADGIIWIQEETVASGTLLPDRFNWDSLSLRTGMYETDFNSSIPDSTLVCEKPELRSREEHWKFIRELLWKNNYSMHYYILADIYYDKQLHGWFRKCEWSIDGIGKLIIYLHSEKEQEKYRVWLLQLVLDPVPPKSVKYTHAPGLSVIRLGEPEMHWDFDKNQVFVYSKE